VEFQVKVLRRDLGACIRKFSAKVHEELRRAKGGVLSVSILPESES
jgi:hypothetical protein